MSEQIKKQSFDYSQLTEDISNQLIEIEFNIRNLSNEALIQIGLQLLEAKKILDHGQFQDWITSTFDFSTRWARELMSVAKVYGPDSKRNHGSVLSFRTLRKLSSKGIPDKVIQKVDRMIDNGEHVTSKKIENLIKQHAQELEQKDNIIKELTEDKKQNHQDFNKTIQEIDRKKEKVIKEQSDYIEQLKKQISQLESQQNIAEPLYEIVRTEQFQDSNGKHEKKIKELEIIISELNQEIISIKEKKAQDDLNIVRKIKSEFKVKEQGYMTKINQLQKEIENLKAEIITEPTYDTEIDADFLSFIKFLDRLETSNNYDEQLINQLEDIKNRINIYLDRMQIDVF